MIKRISIDGHDLSAAVHEGLVISQTDRARWRVTLHMGSDDAAQASTELLANRVGASVEVEVHETRGTILRGGAVISRFDPLTRYTELTGATRFVRERAPREEYR